MGLSHLAHQMSQDCHWPTIKKKVGAWHILFSYWEYRVQKKTKLGNQLKVNIGLICVCSNLPFWEKASPDNNFYSTPVTGSYDSPTFSLRCITSLLGLPWHSSRYFHLLHTVACESLGTPCRICENVNNFNKIREIIQNACYFLFSTVLSKIFYIKYVYI